mmetsp:Transcript_29596/g.95620  ORF Transcript_29596/g.95620 Transcript_29596/m.95620 type:complete len:343 (+) Transcript_29596:501-1529(+)
MHATREGRGRVVIHGGVSRRSRWLFRRQGAGEGHLDPGAALQEPDHRRPRLQGQHPLRGNLIDTRAEVKVAHRVQERPVRCQAQHIQRRHPGGDFAQGHGGHFGPGGGAACWVRAKLRPGHHSLAAGVYPPRHLHSGRRARVHLSQDSFRPSRRRRPPRPPLQGGGGSRHPSARAAGARTSGELPLLAEDRVCGTDAAPHDLGGARPRMHGRHGLLRQQAARARGAAALAALRGLVQEAVRRAESAGQLRALQGLHPPRGVGSDETDSGGHPHVRLRKRNLEWQLVGEALQDGAVGSYAGALTALFHFGIGYDDSHHVPVREDAQGVRSPLAPAVPVGHAVP